MANEKQSGSNLINVEYGNGRCPTHCEQCFVNFGPKGTSQCRDLASPGKGSSREFAKRMGKKYGLYEPGIPVPKNVKIPKDHERLAWKITRDSKGLYNFPNKGAWDKDIINASSAACVRFDTVEYLEDLGSLPVFLRVSSMSDMGYAPVPWVKLVQNAWGDYCFFSSAIRTMRKMKGTPQQETYEVADKLCITLNPGEQAPPPMRPAVSRNRDANKRKAENKPWELYIEREFSFRNTMKGRRGQNIKSDFMNPQLPRDIGLGAYEQKIKFYRLRALPSIMPRLPDDVDNPVVITMLRFNGFQMIAEFARRYNLNCEVISKANTFRYRHAKDLFGDVADFKVDRSLAQSTAYLWTDRNDRRNASPFAGEASTFVFEDSWWRPQEIDAFNSEPYVCDRLRGGCAHCGLCASLDGTGSTLEGVPWSNPLNVGPGGKMLLPLPYAENAGYIGVFLPERIKSYSARVKGGRVSKSKLLPPGGDVFASHMRSLGYPLDVPPSLLEWRSNPEEPLEVATPADAAAMFADAAAYMEGEERFYDDWNTHENAVTAVAYGFWSLFVQAKLDGMSKAQAYEWVGSILDRSTGGVEITAGIPEDPWEIWDDESLWNEQFGPTDPRELWG